MQRIAVVKCNLLLETILDEVPCILLQNCADNSLLYTITKSYATAYGLLLGQVRRFVKMYEEGCKKVKWVLCDEVFEFEVLKVVSEVRSGKLYPWFAVKDPFNNIIEVSGFHWQNGPLWRPKFLKCEIVNYDNNLKPLLLCVEDRHPFFEVAGIYDFTITTNSSRYDIFTKKTYTFLILTGIDGCTYEVNTRQGQIFFEGEIIKCRVLEIGGHLRLSQVNYNDDFFIAIEEIVDDYQLIKKYFYPVLFGGSGDNPIHNEIRERYNRQKAFWAITFTLKELPALFNAAIERQDFNEAKEVNNLLRIFENWIVTGGILASFEDDEMREKTLITATKHLENTHNINIFLQELIDGTDDIFLNEKLFNNHENQLINFQYLIAFYSFKTTDEHKLAAKVSDILEASPEPNDATKKQLKRIMHLLSGKKIFYHNEIMSKRLQHPFNNVLPTAKIECNSLHMTFSFCELQIAVFTHNWKHANTIAAHMIAQLSFCNYAPHFKKLLLVNVFHYLNFRSDEIISPFFFEKDVTLVPMFLPRQNLYENVAEEAWELIKNSYAAKVPLTVTLIKKYATGYDIVFNDVKGFLPKYFYTHLSLLEYPFEDCDFSVSVICTAYNRSFNYFLVKQFKQSDEAFILTNNQPFKPNEVYDGLITAVRENGCLVTTEFGSGLLYKDGIFDEGTRQVDARQIFSAGKWLKLLAYQPSKEKRPTWNISKIKDLNPQYFDKTFEKPFLEVPHKDAFKKFGNEDTIRRMASSIEKFAFLETELEEKIHSFKLARQLYINCNNAKSYLLNVYLLFYNFLTSMKHCIEAGEVKTIETLKLQASAIKEQIMLKTIEVFPQTEKVVQFVDLMHLFNNTDRQAFNYLFAIVNDETISKDQSIHKIAVVVLANNSFKIRAKENLRFCFKNLQAILNYAMDGFLDLHVPVESKVAEELQESVV